MLLFDNRRDAISRLEGTIVFYQGRAMMVHGIDEKLRLVGRIVLTGDEAVVKQDDPELNMACPSLGYVNSPDDALYFMRVPMRRWKQGIDTRAIVCPSAGIRGRGAVNEQMIAECLEGNYPSLDRALGMFASRNPFKQDQRRAVAFSRHFAIRRGGNGHTLAYKGKEVGVVENGTPILSTKHIWLTELLESELS